MLPLVCNDAVAILFMFDLTRKSTLNSIKEWYRQARGFNKVRLREIIGSYDSCDHLDCNSISDRNKIRRVCKFFERRARRDYQTGKLTIIDFPTYDASVTQARRFSRAMKAPLIFCSTSHSINIQKIFKIVLSKVFDLKCTIPRIEEIGDPILEY